VAVPARTLEEVIAEAVREAVRGELAPVLLRLERMSAAAVPGPVSIEEAARRLGITVRDVQRRLKDGRLEASFVGGVRMVRWPPPNGPR
jgi:excisionase family DNA binding protein